LPGVSEGDPIGQLRANAEAYASSRPRLAEYLEKVRTCAYGITDADVDALKRAGVTEDEIFEQTVAVAIGEGLRRLDAAERAIG
jgi:alkylhydroperoxidase family enzyme